MFTERKALHAFVIIGAAALFGLSTATAWAGSQKANPSAQGIGLDKNKFATGGAGPEGGIAAAVVAAGVPTEIESVVIFATNSVALDSNVTVTGDVVVNDVNLDEDGNPLPVLEDGVGLDVDRRATVTGNVAADSVKLASQSEIDGDVDTNDLDSNGNITGTTTLSLTLPVFDPVPSFREAPVRPDSPDVDVAPGQTVVLPSDFIFESPANTEGNDELLIGDGNCDPGEICITPIEFGDIVVAKNGTVEFAGGIFNVRSISPEEPAPGNCGNNNPQVPSDACVAFTFSAASEVRVEEQFDAGNKSYVGPADGASIDASDIVFFVAGANGPNASDSTPTALPPAVSIQSFTTIKANVYAANGTVFLAKNTDATGAFLGRDVQVHKDAVVNLDSFFVFVNEAPVADPQTVLTDDASSVEILLTGSDPEDGNLTFGILGDGCPSCTGPSAGALSGLAEIVPAPVEVEDPDNTVGDDSNLIGNGFCDPGEDCIFIQPATTSATVTYTPDFPLNNDEDSFTFSVTDPEGAFGIATVDINPFDPSPAPDDPVDTVVANDIFAATTAGVAVPGTPVILTLTGEAPCDGPCDGVGGTPFDDDVPLTFSIVAATGPFDGVLSAVTPGGEVPRRTATVTYTPDADFSCTPNPEVCDFPDSFDFEACGNIGGTPTCDTGTATIDVLEARPVEALPQTVSVPENTGQEDPEVGITLTAIAGGEGEETQPIGISSIEVSQAGGEPAADSGSVTDSDGDGLGDLAATRPEQMSTAVLTGSSSTVTAGLLGTVVATITPPVAIGSQFCSIGLAFDGQDLYFNQCSNSVIYSFDPLNPAVLGGSFDTSTASPDPIAEDPNAMAFDLKRNGLWIGTQKGKGATGFSCGTIGVPIYFWDFDTNLVTEEFVIPLTLINPATSESFLSFCFVDGLAYNENDPTTDADDEIWFSDDINKNLGVFRPNGTLVSGFDATALDAGLSTLSGLAIGGENLYMANNGLGDLFRADSTPLSLLAQATASPRLEDIACDPTTFPEPVMWVRSTPQGVPAQDIITAFEIEPNTCGIGGQGPGTRRVHIEFDLSFSPFTADELVSATVVLDTEKGPHDSKDTEFFFGTVGNGTLAKTDFEDAFLDGPAVIMPVPDVPEGTPGTFSFGITELAKAVLADGSNDFLTIQGRVDNENDPVAGNGLQIFTNASTSPPEIVLTGPGIPVLFFFITSLPANGTLTDPVLGLITLGSLPFQLSGNVVIYEADAGFTGTDSFEWQVDDTGTGTSDTAIVTMLVQEVPLGDCVLDLQFCDDGRS